MTGTPGWFLTEGGSEVSGSGSGDDERRERASWFEADVVTAPQVSPGREPAIITMEWCAGLPACCP